MSRKISELSPKEVLALAIQIEQANGECLRKFAKAFDGYDPKVAEKFRELAEEEDLHEVWLTEKFKSRFKGPIPPIEALDVEDMGAAVEWESPPNNVVDILKADEIYQQALAAEYRARKFYEEAGSVASDKSLVLLFRQLAKMENDHAGWLEKKIQALT